MLGVPLFFRFLVAILVVQAATAALTLVAFRHDTLDLQLAVAALALLTAVLSAFWFSGLAGRYRQQVKSKMEARLSRERQKLKTEKEQRKELAREHRRVRWRSNSRAVLLFGGLVATGGFLMLTQFMTLGLLLVSGAGGAVAGYLARGRVGPGAGELPVDKRPPLISSKQENG